MELQPNAGKLSLLFSAMKFRFINNMVALKLHWISHRTGVFGYALLRQFAGLPAALLEY
jgi:hypothetical protein